MNNLSIRLGSRLSVSFISLALTGLVFAGVLAWILGGYFGYDIHTLLSGVPSDPPGNVVVGSRIIGVHSYGDYLLPHDYAVAGNPWINSLVPANNYPPIAMAIFWFLSFLPYKLGLGVFLLLAFMSMLYPVFNELKRNDLFGQYGVILVPCILSVGVIAALDRGNCVAFLVTPLYLFIRMIREEKWTKSVLLLSFMVALKVYPILLLVLYIRKRKFNRMLEVVLYSVGASVLVTALFPGRVVQTLKAVYLGVAGFGSSGDSGLNPFNVSLFSDVSRILNGKPQFKSEFDFISSHAWWAGIFYMTLILSVILLGNIPFEISLFLAVSTLWLVPPVNFHYVTSLVLAPLAMAVSGFGKSTKRLKGSPLQEHRVLNSLTTLSVFLTMTPIIIPMAHARENGMRTYSGLCWLTLGIVACYTSFKIRFSKVVDSPTRRK